MFEKTFCPSPWFHMRIDNQGNFRSCRWRRGTEYDLGNIRDMSPDVYFQQYLAPFRQSLLAGESSGVCSDCYHMEEHGKISGRQRQLLKVGVYGDFAKSLRSSPVFDQLTYSQENQGYTNLSPQDWQIDLGNYCNGACIFCSPGYSSRLATEFKKIGLIDVSPSANWTDDPVLVEKFCDMLERSNNLKYLHFLGGETLITPAFKYMLERLVSAGHVNLDIGFTTNLTVWPEEVIGLLKKFNKLHVGLSVECLTDLNDYLRYPAQISTVKTLLDRWVDLSRSNGWLIQLRPTPNCFSIQHLDTIYDYAIENNVGVETCNFFENPVFMRISVLSRTLLDQARHRLQAWLERYQYLAQGSQVINTRNPDTLKFQIYQDAQSYLSYIDGEKSTISNAVELVRFIQRLENNRKNRILDYLPEYETFLRSAGY